MNLVLYIPVDCPRKPVSQSKPSVTWTAARHLARLGTAHAILSSNNNDSQFSKVRQLKIQF
jgi:hypothetical protein